MTNFLYFTPSPHSGYTVRDPDVEKRYVRENQFAFQELVQYEPFQNHIAVLKSKFPKEFEQVEPTNPNSYVIEFIEDRYESGNVRINIKADANCIGRDLPSLTDDQSKENQYIHEMAKYLLGMRGEKPEQPHTAPKRPSPLRFRKVTPAPSRPYHRTAPPPPVGVFTTPPVGVDEPQDQNALLLQLIEEQRRHSAQQQATIEQLIHQNGEAQQQNQENLERAVSQVWQMCRQTIGDAQQLHERQMQFLQQGHEQIFRYVDQSHRATLAELGDSHTRQMKALQQTHREAMAAIQEGHNRNLDAISREALQTQETLLRLITNLRKEIKKTRQTIGELRRQIPPPSPRRSASPPYVAVDSDSDEKSNLSQRNPKKSTIRPGIPHHQAPIAPPPKRPVSPPNHGRLLALLRQENQDLHARIGVLEAECDSNRSQLTGLTSQRDTLKKQLDQLREKYTQQSQNLLQLEDELWHAQSQSQTLSQTTEQLQERLHFVISESEKREKDLVAEIERLKRLRLHPNPGSNQEQEDLLRAQLEQIRTALIVARKETARFQLLFQESQDSVQLKDEEIQRLYERINDLIEENQDLEQENTKLLELYEKQTQFNKDLYAENRFYERKLSQMAPLALRVSVLNGPNVQAPSPQTSDAIMQKHLRHRNHPFNSIGPRPALGLLPPLSLTGLFTRPHHEVTTNTQAESATTQPNTTPNFLRRFARHIDLAPFDPFAQSLP